MSDRFSKIGIKQTIQKHWMDYVVKMMLAGFSEKEIRTELKKFLASQKQSGGIGKRGEKTFAMAIGPLSSWFSPCSELVNFRDNALALIQRKKIENWLPVHWAIMSASYPFWFNVAKQTGRLLNLQEKVTQAQVFNRLKEQFGDRETVTRNARYTIRSYNAWGVLKDTEKKGCYFQNKKMQIEDPNIQALLYEAALHTLKDGTATLDNIAYSPAFFPFNFLSLSTDSISKSSSNIEIIRLGLNDNLLKLKHY